MKIKGIYFLYRSLQAFGFPLLLLYFLYRSLQNRAYLSSLPQRLGFLPRPYRQTLPGAIWLHAVSVGELMACAELVRQLHAALPKARLFVSTSTLAGRSVADTKFKDADCGIFYAPVDYVFAIRRVLRMLQPSVVVIAETEIWPTLFREVKRIGSGLIVVNGRISDRAALRYLALRSFFRSVLRWPDLILAQSRASTALFLRLGAPPEKVRLGGNFKYDFRLSEAEDAPAVKEFLARTGPHKIWIAASTMPPAVSGDVDEDDAVIRAFQELSLRFAGLLLLIAPRRPERFEIVAHKLEQAGVRFIRRSAIENSVTLQLPGVLLLDSMGELSGLFQTADVVFMGGSLAARGGHNLLEPALCGRPVVFGPHMENFREIAEEFRAAGACIRIGSASELAGSIASLLEDPERALQLGKKAQVCAAAGRGAIQTAVEEIQRLYLDCWPSYRPPAPAFFFLWPLAQIWKWGGRCKRSRALRMQKLLDAPVISIGNITMGGTGKTPLVLYLAEKLKNAGYKPGILTRGYGRQSFQKHLAAPPGARLPVMLSGDEPQIFLNSGLAPVGIGPDRFRTGKLLEEKFQTDVLILDDGFQQHRLCRQVDIVLIDALNPFGGSEVFPLGRLREPMTALERAHVLVITRTECGRAVEAIERQVRRYNAHAPLFRARVLPDYWEELGTARRFQSGDLPESRFGAFCGLGNPESFWCTLSQLGIRTLDCVEFGDHHSYKPSEIRRLAEQFRSNAVEAILTTEKDRVNLGDDCVELFAPLRVYWLKIRCEVDREQDFLDGTARQAARTAP